MARARSTSGYLHARYHIEMTHNAQMLVGRLDMPTPPGPRARERGQSALGGNLKGVGLDETRQYCRGLLASAVATGNAIRSLSDNRRPRNQEVLVSTPADYHVTVSGFLAQPQRILRSFDLTTPHECLMKISELTMPSRSVNIRVSDNLFADLYKVSSSSKMTQTFITEI
jgi:hypothetical protein